MLKFCHLRYGMQIIPLIYGTIVDQKLHAGKPVAADGRYTVEDTVPAVSIECLKTRAERGKVIVVDTVGISRRHFYAPFIESCKTPGNDLWLVEPIYDDIDVLDAFLGSADRLVFPYTCIKNDSVLPDIIDISDQCVPLLVCREGTYGGKDPVRLVEHLAGYGFHNIMVADMDGSVPDERWEDMTDQCGGLITYSPFRKIEKDVHILAEDVFPF